MRTLLFISALFFNVFISIAAFAQDAVGTGSHTAYETEVTSTQNTVAWVVGLILLVIVLYVFFRGSTKSRIIGRKSSRKDRAHLDG